MAEMRAMMVLPHMTYGIRMNAEDQSGDVWNPCECRFSRSRRTKTVRNPCVLRFDAG